MTLETLFWFGGLALTIFAVNRLTKAALNKLSSRKNGKIVGK